MKKYFLSLLIGLISLVSLAQQPGDQLVKIRECRTCPVLWQAYTARNLSTFPLTDKGDRDMEDAAMLGAFTLRLANGAVVPAGTVPPRIPPNPPTVSWLTSVLASYDATTKLLYIEAAGASDVQLMFEQVSGAALAGGNPDGAQLVNSVFYDYGTNTASHPAQWRFGKKDDGSGGIPTNALRLTFRRSSNAAVTVAYTYTPKAGDTKIVLTGSSSSPPSDAGPTWMSARYTYNANRLDVEGAPISAPNVTLNIKRADGQPMSIQSSGGQELNTVDFYPSGPLQNQGAYSQEWSFTPRNGGGVPQVPIVLTFKKQDGTTFAKTVTPAPGTRTTLFAASTGGGTNPTNPTTPTTPTLAVFQRGLALGNSITSHQANTALGWDKNNGMAASTPDKDYVHVMEAALKTKNPSFILVPKGQGSSFEQIYASSDPDAVNNTLSNLNFELKRDFGNDVKFDLVLFSISENITGTFDETKFRAMLDKVLAGIPLLPNPTIVLRNSFWSGNDACNAVLQAYASEKGYKFVNLSAIRERADYKASQYTNPSVAHHPNDAGHAAIAQLFLAQLSTSGGTTPGGPIVNGFNYPTPAAQAAWTGFNPTNLNGFTVGDVITRENEFLKIEIRKTYGAGLQIYDKAAGNHPIFNYHDHGRSSELTLYSGPANYSQDMGGTWAGIGWNPITVGTEGGANAVGSPVQSVGIVTDQAGREWIYTKIQMVSWPHIPVRYLEVFSEQWRRLEGNTVLTKFRVQLARTDKAFYEVRQQEWPCFMVSGNTGTVHFYNGNNPFTGAGYVSTNTIESGQIGNNAISWEQKAFHISEPWQAMQFKPGRYVGMWTPNYYTTTNHRYVINSDNTDWEGANATTYMTNLPNLIIDSDGLYYGEFAFKVDGSVDAIRNWANSQPRQTKPDWTFNQANGRNEWVVWKGTDQKVPFTSDNWKVTYVGENGNAQGSKLMSPVGSWKATDSPVIYLRMKYTGSVNQFYLTWLLTGQQADGQSPEYPNQNSVRNPNGVRNFNDQHLTFPVQADGQWHTYAVPVGTHGNWKNYIQQFEIGNFVGSAVAPGQQLEISYIGANNPGN